MMENMYRHLTQDEIRILESSGCEAQDWNLVTVSATCDFLADRIIRTGFSGEVKLGDLSGEVALKSGMVLKNGILNATLHNVTIGDRCCIRNVRRFIANYDIGDDCFVEDVGVMSVDCRSSFGNGVKVSVLDETGGREVTIFDRLSSHLAYMIALYRHRPRFIEKVQTLIDGYVESVRSSRGTVGAKSRIVETQEIVNVRFGPASRIEGAGRLCNGSVNSTLSAPVHIGHGTICEDFIISSGSEVMDCAMLSSCFIGQACRMSHGYSASHSLFFCNCQGENGEACSVFAGPYTVTHHKSTLLIAGMFSFMNAGSGSNQSNHMYKLGPIHQGTLERGAKTSSDSYILWPSRVGAFSLVMGRHVAHSDTTNLPFSYLIENNNRTYLVPGVNLRSVGTIRDARKWPTRDSRTDSDLLDNINYNLLSPFTVQKMMRGSDILENLKRSSGELNDEYSFHSTRIKNKSLKEGLEFYRMAIDKFMGNSLISRLQSSDGTFTRMTDEQIRERLIPDSDIGEGEWIDLSGLIAPKSEVRKVMDSVEDGTVSCIGQLSEMFTEMYRNYYSYEWTWVYSHFEDFYGVSPLRITKTKIAELVDRWHTAVTALDKMIYEDARKEFSLASQTGFGADGDRRQKESDFGHVRGEFEKNSFVASIRDHIRDKTELRDKVKTILV